MITYPSQTKNGGGTIILDSAAEATRIGDQWIQENGKRVRAMGDAGQVKLTYHFRDSAKKKTLKKSMKTYKSQWIETEGRWTGCREAIVKGSDADKTAIAELAEKLAYMAVEIEPTLTAAGFKGWERSEDGVDADPDLVSLGDDRPCWRRRKAALQPKEGVSGEGAYRIVINTDVSWWGKADDNAAVMAALVRVLQNSRPVEIWIQQGWLGPGGINSEHDGVTLFKLDFTTGFEPTQLAFWVGHKDKDCTYSWAINKALGRDNHATSTVAEIPCDLYMRGDWMTLHGIHGPQFAGRPKPEQLKIMAAWVAATAFKIAYGNPLANN